MLLVSVGTGTNIFVGNMGSEVEGAFSKFVNNTLEGKFTRDLDRLERWACALLGEFNKAKCKVLHMDQGNTRHKYSLSRDWIANSPAGLESAGG